MERNILEAYVVAALSATANLVGSDAVRLTLADGLPACVHNATMVHTRAGRLTRLKALRPGYILNALLHLVQVLTPPIELAQARQVERVDEQAVLDLQIERRIAAERRR